MSAVPDKLFGSARETTDAQETREWMDALSAVMPAAPMTTRARTRAHFLLEQLLEHARQTASTCRFSATTGYVNTIEPDQEERCPGNLEIEERLRAYMRWNAMAMVVKANRHNPADGGDLGGHIGSFASLANLFGAGFNHFWHAESENHGGDCIYIQGHVSPGVYARAYLEGRLTEEQLLNFRQEVDGKGLSSYPHPKLMPEFWQFPTVSMGLGPLMAIYQARFLKYLHARGIANTENRKVWVFCGDGEMDEVESLGAIGLAAREGLDNLVFVINCNLQRLDGPVRGNGKIIQELEGEFRGSGWNVIKLLWGSNWDPLLARDKDGALRKIMMDTLDGDYQAFKANDGAYVRKHFFGRDPRTLEMVAKMSDDDIWNLRRGGHDPQKVYAAFHAGREPQGPADRAADQDRQGLWHGQDRRGQEHRAPDQEADRRRHQGLPRPLQHPHPRQRAAQAAVLQAGRRHARDAVPARAPQGAGRLPAAPPHQGRRELHVPSLETFKAVLEPTPRAARSPPPRPMCAS
jgi:pyruvate dehydrogenase E1 component